MRAIYPSGHKHEDLVTPLIEAARAVRLNAYAPYSDYLVGVALIDVDKRIHVGCNVEGADYDVTHAEESALSALVAAGLKRPVMAAVVGGKRGEEPVLGVPCGKCRQKFQEFRSLYGQDIAFVVLDEDRNLRLAMLGDILPSAFGPADIGVDLAAHRK